MIHEYKNTETYRSSEPEARKRLSQHAREAERAHGPLEARACAQADELLNVPDGDHRVRTPHGKVLALGGEAPRRRHRTSTACPALLVHRRGSSRRRSRSSSLGHMRRRSSPLKRPPSKVRGVHATMTSGSSFEQDMDLLRQRMKAERHRSDRERLELLSQMQEAMREARWSACRRGHRSARSRMREETCELTVDSRDASLVARRIVDVVEGRGHSRRVN